MKRLQQTAYFLIVLVLGVIVLKEGAFLLVPLVWGIFFAFALYPISSWFEKRRFPRAMAIALSLVLVSAIVGGVLYLLLYQMVELIREIPSIGANLQQKISNYYDELGLLIGEDFVSPDQKTEVLSFWNTGGWNETLFTTGKSLTLAGIIPLYSFLLLYYKDFFTEFLVRLSSKNKDLVLTWAADSGHVIQSYLAGILRVTAIVAALAGIFFYLMGIKFFILFAVFIAVMNLIPYVGVVVSSFFVILYVFLTSDSIVDPLITLATLWAIQLVENNLITPWVVGSKVKVNALAVLLAILLGGWIWGISGMVLFIPLVGVLKLTLERSPTLSPFAYLLSDDVPISESAENFWKIMVRRYKKRKLF